MSKKNRAWIPVWAIIIASVLIAFEYGKVPPAAPNMMEVLGISYTTQGLMMTMFSIAAAGMLVGGTAMGLVLARTKDKGLLLFVDMLVCAIGLFLWFNLDIGVVGTYVIAFVLGCFLGAAPTVFFAMAPEVARSPKTVGAATAVVVLGQNGGTLAVPAIVGMILDSAGYGAAAMTMGALSLAACAICLLVFRRIYNKSIRSTRE